jgi:D-serine deaminase-like pyridoxal phosphate-dependent protein
VAADAGIERVLIANEVVDDEGLAWIGDHLDIGTPELFAYVDSVVGVARMTARLTGRRRPLKILIEVGVLGGRTGVRSVAEALAVAEAVAATPALVLAGVSLYEGAVPGATAAIREPGIRAMAAMTREVTERLAPAFVAAGVEEIVVTGGGSHSFDVVAEELTRPWTMPLPVRVVLRSGAYVTHDHGIYERSSPLRSGAATADGPRLLPAIEVWAPLLSVPEPGLAIAGAGRRDLPVDQDLPVVIKIRRDDDGRTRPAGSGFTVERLNDQHAFIALTGEASVAVGDLVAFGISHPCTAFQLWREALVVDDDDRILEAYELRF